MSDSLSEHRARIDEMTYAMLSAVARSCGHLGISWMITGAAGRFILLEQAYKLPSALATEDLDFAVMVEGWLQYRRLREEICKDSRFRQDTKQGQRLDFEERGYVDLIPFGGVESIGHVIEWPPERDFVMRVLGFRDAYEDAVQVLVNESLTVPVVSPEGLVLLKLFAWEDRHHAQPGKDARDIAYVLLHYESLLTVDVLFEHHFVAVEATDYDLALAAATALGEKIRVMASAEALAAMKDLLARELALGIDSALITEMAQYSALTEPGRVFELMASVHGGLG